MTILFDRQIEVQVAGLTISALRISLSIERELDKTQDKGEVAIYNLKDEHEDQIYERGRRIVVRAGYPQTAAIVFEGEVQRITRARENLARVTRIKLGDHVRHKDTLSGVYAGSWEGPVPVREIAVAIASEGLRLPVGPLDAIPEDATFTNFYWGGQSAAVALSRLLDSVRCIWFEDDEVIRINRTDRLQPDAPAVVVSPETGLIGTPRATDEGAECRMFLNPAVRLGGLLTIESANVDGRWKVVGIKHAGDNWEGKFETFCDLRAIDADAVSL